MPVTVEALFRLNEQVTRPLAHIRRENERTQRSLKETQRQIKALEGDLALLGRIKASPKVRADTTQLTRDLARARLELDTLTKRPYTANVRVQLSGMARARAQLASLGGGAAAGGGGLLPLLLGAGVGAAGPLLGGAAALGGAGVAGAAGLAGGLGAAVGGVALFAGVAVPALKKVKESWEAVTKAQEALKNAKTAEAQAEALKKLAEANKALDPQMRQLVSNAKAVQQAWATATGPIVQNVYQISNAFLRTAQQLIPEFAPQMRAMGDMFERVGKGFAQFLRSEREVGLLHQAIRPLPDLLERMAAGAQNVFKILQGTFIAALPVTSHLVNAFNRLTGGLAEMLTSEQGIERLRRNFMSWVPILDEAGRFMSTLWQSLVRLARAGQPFAVNLIRSLRTMLTAITDVAVALTEQIGPVLPGVLDALSSAFRNIGTNAVPTLKALVQGIGYLSDALAALPGPIAMAAGAFIALASAMKLVGLGGAGTLLKGLTGTAATATTAAQGGLIGAFKALFEVSRAGGTVMQALQSAMRFIGPQGLIVAGVAAVAGLGYAFSKLFSDSAYVSDAQRRVNDALRQQKDDATAAKDAILGLRDAQLGLAEAGVTLKEARLEQREAQSEWQRIRRDPTASALDRERAFIRTQRANLRAAAAGRALREQQQGALAQVQAAGPAASANIVSTARSLDAVNRQIAQLRRARQGGVPGALLGLQGQTVDQALAGAIGERNRLQGQLRAAEGAASRVREQTSGILTNLGRSPKAAQDLATKLTTTVIPAFNAVQQSAGAQFMQWLAQTRTTGFQAPTPAAPPNLGNWSPVPVEEPGAQFGGIFHSRTNRTIAEAGSEAVVPLGPGRGNQARQLMSSLARMGAAQGGRGHRAGGPLVQVVVNGNIGSQSDLDAFSLAVSRGVERALATTSHAAPSGMFA